MPDRDMSLILGVALGVSGLLTAVLFAWLRKDEFQLESARTGMLKHRLRQIAGSFLSISAGCIVGATLMLLLMGGWRTPQAFFPVLFFFGLAVLPVWLLVLLPLYMFLSRHSILWRPPVAASLGSIGGFLIMVCLMWIHNFDPGSQMPDWLLLFLAALVGCTTCFYAAATVDLFGGGTE
jgi:hypothetical protein